MPAHDDQRRIANSIPNPFEDGPQRLSEYTAQEIATLQSRLNKQLGPEYISTRPGAGGGKVAYLAAEKVINLANEVFGFNGWSSSIQNVQIDFVDESQSTGKISLGLSIIVRVTLKDGTYHEDIGYGQIENCKGKAAAFEKAKKEAATDGLKRALRTFGNVLGNCLYDKDYLNRVKTLKVAPVKWDVENLHRHRDYAPQVKVEAAPAEAPQAKPAPVVRKPSQQLATSTSMEFEDEFGGDVFEGVIIEEGHGDEVTLDSIVGPDSTAKSLAQRTQSVPPPTTNNGRPALPAPQQQGQQQQPRPAQPLNPNVNQSSRSSVHGPQHGNHGSRPPNRPAQSHLNQHPINQNAQRGNGATPPESGASNGVAQPGNNEPPATVTFVNSRAAEILQKSDNPASPLPPNVPAFNPHLESPSLRRTSGINHKTSAPISRQAVGIGGAMANAAPGVANGHINGPQGLGSVPGKPNFVNPQADLGRRIGMPNGAQSPLANRSAYKPPTMNAGAGIKRPNQAINAGPGPPQAADRQPLADLSNVHSDSETVDVKRAKVGGA